MGLLCLLAAHLLQCRSSLSPLGERTFTFVFLYSIIMAATVSLGRPWVSSICSIFPLCMESKTLERSTNKAQLSRHAASYQALSPLGGARFIAWRLCFLGECRRDTRHFGAAGCVGARAPLYKRPCAVRACLVGRRMSIENILSSPH